MSKVYCPFLAKTMGGRAKAFTFSLLLGLGVNGVVACSDDEQPDEAIKTEAGTDEAAAPPEAGDGATGDGINAADAPSELDGPDQQVAVDEAPPPEETASAESPPPEAGNELADMAAAPAAPQEAVAEPESDAMLNEAESQAPAQDLAQAPMQDAAVDSAPVEANTQKQVKFTPVSAQSGAKGSGGSYIVQPGDTLAGIAAKVYGQSDMWHAMATLNGINAPYRIYPGDELQFDASNEHSKSYAQHHRDNMETVTVESGDSLSSIAKDIWGHAGNWKVLFALNKDKIQDPNRIAVGMELRYVSPTQASATVSDDESAPEQPVKKTKKSASVEAPAKKGKAGAKLGNKPKKATGH